MGPRVEPDRVAEEGQVWGQDMMRQIGRPEDPEGDLESNQGEGWVTQGGARHGVEGKY